MSEVTRIWERMPRPRQAMLVVGDLEGKRKTMRCCEGDAAPATRPGFVLDENVTGCTCLEPGWCERHRCIKSGFLFELCRRRRDFFQSWEQGQGIGQEASTTPPPKPRTDCVHRGKVVDELACPTCHGAVRVKIFACALHVQCTLATALNEIACCVTCPDYQVCAG